MKLVVIIAVALSTLSFASQVTHTADLTSTKDNQAVYQTPQSYKNTTDQILTSDKYSEIYEEKGWQRVTPKADSYTEDTNESDDSWFKKLTDFLSDFSVNLGIFGKILALGVLAVIVYLLVKNSDKLNFILDKLPKKRHSVTHIDLTHQKPVFYDLPEHDSIGDVVQALIDQGQYLQALSMLYRGTLRALNMQYDLDIDASHTEAVCQKLLRIATTSTAERRFFDELVDVWQMAAYGKYLPDNAKVRLTKLLDAWRKCYQNMGDRHGTS